MNEILQALIVPLVLALMTAVKAIPVFAPDPLPDGPRKNAWLLPWIAAGLGSGLAVVWGLAFSETIPTSLAARALLGLFAGLSAAGLYDGTLQPLKAALRGNVFGDYGLVLALAVGLALVCGGCGLPQAVITTTQFEQSQLESDKALVNQLFDQRRTSVEALIRAQDVALEQSITGREAAAKAGTPLVDKDGNPLLDAAGKPRVAGFDAAWVRETFAVADLVKAGLRKRLADDERDRRLVLDNINLRKANLAQASDLVVRSQQWSSETAGLVKDLLAQTLKNPAQPLLMPAADAAP